MTEKYELILNTSFISLNEYILAERNHKIKAAKIKKEQTNKVYYLAKELKFKLPENTRFNVTFIWFAPDNRKDHDNIAFAKKFILDGLVLAKILKSDGAKYIGNFQDKFELDKTRPYVSCIVTFIEIKLQ